MNKVCFSLLNYFIGKENEQNQTVHITATLLKCANLMLILGSLKKKNNDYFLFNTFVSC